MREETETLSEPTPTTAILVKLEENAGRRIDKLIGMLQILAPARENWVHFFLKYLLAPIVVVAVGFYFDFQLERSKFQFDQTKFYYTERLTAFSGINQGFTILIAHFNDIAILKQSSSESNRIELEQRVSEDLSNLSVHFTRAKLFFSENIANKIDEIREVMNELRTGDDVIIDSNSELYRLAMELRNKMSEELSHKFP